MIEFGTLSQCFFCIKERLAFTEKAHGFDTLQCHFFQERDKSNFDNVPVSVWHFIISYTSSPPRAVRCVADFSTWDAVTRELRNIQIIVHLIGLQAIWRRIQEVALPMAYMRDGATRDYQKKLTALPFLHHSHIPPISSRLRQLTYIHSTWAERSVWPPNTWSMYLVSVLEIVHRRLSA